MRVFPGLTPWTGVVASAGSAFPCHQNVGGVSKADSGPVCNLSGRESGTSSILTGRIYAGVSAGEIAGSRFGRPMQR